MKLPMIQGREAVPVRLIPIITHNELGQASLTGILANRLDIGSWHYPSDFDEIEVDVYDEETDTTERTTKTRAELIGPQGRDNEVAAYHLNDGKTPVKMWATEWDVIRHDIKLLEPVLREIKKKNGVPQSMEPVWRLEATKKLPPGVFLWREDMDLLWQRHTDYYGRTPYEPAYFRKGVNYEAYISPEYRALVWEGFEHLRSNLDDSRKSNGLLESEATMSIQISYSDFVMLCQVHDPAKWAPWLSIKPEGVWIMPPPDDVQLAPTERSQWHEHPEKDLTKPLVTFPCSLLQLQAFLEQSGVYGCIDPFDMAEFVCNQEGKISTEAVNINHEEYPEEIQVAILVYKEFWENRPKDMNPATNEMIEKYINKHLGKSASTEAIKRIRTMARPNDDKTGGAPNSEKRTFKGHSVSGKNN
jgi:hypothetical protein